MVPSLARSARRRTEPTASIRNRVGHRRARPVDQPFPHRCPGYPALVETWDAIRARKNVRDYDGRPIPAEHLDQILEAGRPRPPPPNGPARALRGGAAAG